MNLRSRVHIRSGAGAIVLASVLVVAIGCAADRTADDAISTSSPVTTNQGIRPSAEGANYAIDFAAPLTFKELGVRILTRGSQDSPPAIANGFLTQGSSLADKVATYFERRAANTVRSMGLQVEFPKDAGSASAVAMIVADGPLPDLNVTRVQPNLGLHFVATAQFWQLDVWPTDGDIQRIAGAEFDSTEFDGPVRYEIEHDAGVARVVQPDGKTFEVNDPRIAEWTGPWMTWELFQDGGSVPSARIQSWWANT